MWFNNQLNLNAGLQVLSTVPHLHVKMTRQLDYHESSQQCCSSLHFALNGHSFLAQKPTPNELPALVAPVAEHMQAATALIEGRRSTVFNHQKAVAESLHALSWMVYTGPNCGANHDLPLCRLHFCILSL